jgi:hypothetical protein
VSKGSATSLSLDRQIPPASRIREFAPANAAVPGCPRDLRLSAEAAGAARKAVAGGWVGRRAARTIVG